jgi:hypothetical protein
VRYVTCHPDVRHSVMPLPVSGTASQAAQVADPRTDNLPVQTVAKGHEQIQSDGLVSGA